MAAVVVAAVAAVVAALAAARRKREAMSVPFRSMLLMQGTKLVTIRKGMGPGNHAWQSPKMWLASSPVTAASAVFFVKFSDEQGSLPFDWSCKGKIGGLYVGTGGGGGAGNGEECDPRAASLRVMWSKEGDAYAYVYTPEGKERHQPPPLNQSCRAVEVFRDQFRGVFKTRGPKGDGWHRISLSMKLGTPNKADGSLALSVNYKQRVLHNVMWRTTPNDGIKWFVYEIFHGGPCRCKSDCHMQVRGPVVYT